MLNGFTCSFHSRPLCHIFREYGRYGQHAFALCQGMEQAMLGAGTTDNGKMAEWLHARTKSDPVRTVLGPFAWDERGLPKNRPFLVEQWQHGQLKFIYPTDEFEDVAKIEYPKPAW